MVRKKAAKKTTALAKWDKELAAAAEAAAAQEANTGGGQFFSMKNGTLSLNDSPLPGNEMAVVIVDSVLENVFYEGDYDPDEPQGPSCFAFGRDEETIEPHEQSSNKQADACAGCENNEWGSSDRGRGKACRNRRRLAVIPAGTMKGGEFFASEVEELAKASIVYLALPPTSINGFGAYVKQVATTLKRPPHAVITRIALVSHPKTQFKVTFELMGPVENEDIGTMMKRHEDERAVIEFPYVATSDEKPAKKTRGRRGKKAKKKAGRKY